MEINRFDEVIGVVPVEDIVEGRMVLLTTHTWDYDFGSRTDLPGVKTPDTAVEAKLATFCITWQVDNRQPPYFEPTPTLAFSLRKGGFDKTSNVPFTSKVRLTYPGYQNGETIPSGTPSLVFGEGTYTVNTEAYVENASIAPGACLQVLSEEESAGNAGKLAYLAAPSDRLIAVVEAYDSTTKDLTFRLVR